MKSHSTFLFAYAGIMACALCAAWWYIGASTQPLPHAYFFSVGQADASLVRADGVQVLIDAGKDGAIIDALDAVMPFLRRRIDMVIISHAEEDHIGGLMDVVRHYDVGCVVFNGQETPLWKHVRQTLDDLRIPVISLAAGDKIRFGSSVFSAIWPVRDSTQEGFPASQTNDNSLAVYFSRRQFSILFPGDISDVIEKRLLAQGLLSHAQVLKVPHHGSKYSSSAAFLAAVSPVWAIIEVGKNSYGHPTQETLARLTEIGARMFRTDTDGTIQVVSRDGVMKLLTTSL